MTLLPIALALAPVLAIAWFIYLKDKYDKEPFRHLLISFFLGGISTIGALALEWGLSSLYPANSMDLFNTAIHAFIIVAASEELVKFVMLRYYAFRQKDFNEPYDGIIYGVMVSLGFAAVENIIYVAEGGISVAILRMFTAVPAHASFGVIMGYYVVLAWQHPGHRFQYMFRGFLAATLLHGVYDFFLFQQNYPAFWFMSFVGLGIAIKLSFNAIKEHQKNSPHKLEDNLIEKP